jgi:hypothetical protein
MYQLKVRMGMENNNDVVEFICLNEQEIKKALALLQSEIGLDSPFEYVVTELGLTKEIAL